MYIYENVKIQGKVARQKLHNCFEHKFGNFKAMNVWQGKKPRTVVKGLNCNGYKFNVPQRTIFAAPQ